MAALPMFYLIGFAVLVSGGLLLLALPGLRSTAETQTNSDSFEECVPVSMRRNPRRPSFPLPKPPPLGSD